MSVKIYIGTDHRGFKLKEELKPLLTEAHEYVEIVDKGAKKYDKNDDYNDFAVAVAKSVAEDKNSFGILICGSAVGMTIQANRFKGVRAVTSLDPEIIKLSREHNNANILCLPADFIDKNTANELIHTFFHTKYLNNERLNRRNKKLDKE